MRSESVIVEFSVSALAFGEKNTSLYLACIARKSLGMFELLLCPGPAKAGAFAYGAFTYLRAIPD
jgi:hypothetical protein